MGKASRTKRRASVRHARASRSGNGVWYALAGVVIVAGVVVIVISAASDSADAAPQNKDHWHAAFGVNVCGEWLPNAPEFEDAEGIHTHGDGLMHIHPFLLARVRRERDRRSATSSSAGGARARIRSRCGTAPSTRPATSATARPRPCGGS